MSAHALRRRKGAGHYSLVLSPDSLAQRWISPDWSKINGSLTGTLMDLALVPVIHAPHLSEVGLPDPLRAGGRAG